METIIFSDSYLMFQANQLAKKPRRLKIANYVDLVLLFFFVAYVLMFGQFYCSGYVTYNVASQFCVAGMLCFGIFSCIAHYFPYWVNVEKNEINQAIETIFLNKEASLKEEIAEAKKEVRYAKNNLKDEKRKLSLANEALKQLYKTKELK
ncbi:MAG: hypothetical protein WCK59_01180 [Candidatus Falkowbacteria bacterium]